MKQVFTFLASLLLTVSVFAQSPEGMSYQAVVRDSDNELVPNSNIGMQISILQGNATGASVYVERHFPSTNSNGLVTVEIGTGTVISGIFHAIEWANGPYFIKTETDLNGGANYTISGTSQLLSVPYALHAKTAETVTGGIDETDPLFDISVAKNITAADIDNWNNNSGAKEINDLTDGKTWASSLFMGEGAGTKDDASGMGNVGIGLSALHNNTTGANNTAIGQYALMRNIEGNGNTGIGIDALANNTTGNNNIAIGPSALKINTIGTDNVSIGSTSSSISKTGSYNTVLGSASNLNNSGGSFNTIVGYRAGSFSSDNSNSGNILLGYEAGSYNNNIGNNKLYIENSSSTTPLIYGDFDDDLIRINGDLEVSGTVKIEGGDSLAIGDSYQGGIIFWLDATGQHGLIAATSDQSTGIHWFNGTYRYTGTTGDGLYAGAMNTSMIVATQMADNQEGNFAAKVCADYSVTDGGVTYGDWYLPSKYELNLLYLQKVSVGGFASAWYWSSTELDNDHAWKHDFVYGGQNFSYKLLTNYVRAVRAF